MGKVFYILLTVPPIINANYRAEMVEAYLGQDDSSNYTTNSSDDSNSTTPSTPEWMIKYTPEAQSLLTFDGFMNFTIGIINGTTMYNVSELEDCRNVIDNSWVNESITAWNDLVDGEWFSMMYNIEDVLYNTNTVAHSCYAGVEEMTYATYNSVSNTTATTTSMLINAAYNFGEIYDDLEALYFFFIQTPYSPGTTPAEAGNMIGEIILLMLTPPVPLADPDDAAYE
jgi:hypothetical protein